MKSARILLCLLAIALILPASIATAAELPNDCAIVATEALARLESTAFWSSVLHINFDDLKAGEIHGHALAIWQLHENGTVLLYDRSGTLELKIHSHELKKIVAELNRINPEQPVLSAHFIE